MISTTPWPVTWKCAASRARSCPTFRPDGTLLLQFGEDGVKITGRNLERVRLAVTECRLRFIREGTVAEADLHTDDATHIESIAVQRAGLEW